MMLGNAGQADISGGGVPGLYYNPLIGSINQSNMIQNREDMANQNNMLNQQSALSDIATQTQNRDIAAQKLPYEIGGLQAANQHTGALTGMANATAENTKANTAATLSKTNQEQLDNLHMDMLRMSPTLDAATLSDMEAVKNGTGKGTPNLDRSLKELADAHNLNGKQAQLLSHYKDAALSLQTQDPNAVNTPFSSLIKDHIIPLSPTFQEKVIQSQTEKEVAGIHSATQLQVTDKEVKSRLDIADKEIAANPEKATTYYADAAMIAEQNGQPEQAKAIRMRALQANKMAETAAKRALDKAAMTQTALVNALAPQAIKGQPQTAQPQNPLIDSSGQQVNDQGQTEPSAPKGQPIPPGAQATDLHDGITYQTARGPMKWNAKTKMFDPVQ